MNRTERFKIVMNILNENDLCNNTTNHTMFDKLNENNFNNKKLIDSIIKKIKLYEQQLESSESKYPEYIMHMLRQRHGMNEYDFSKDAMFNSYSRDKVLSDVCIWEGLLGGYDSTIKNWVRDIYGVNLDNII